MKRQTLIISTVLLMGLLYREGNAQSNSKSSIMKRDIEVSESVLSTILKQQHNHRRRLFPIRVKGEYIDQKAVLFQLSPTFFGPRSFSYNDDVSRDETQDRVLLFEDSFDSSDDQVDVGYQVYVDDQVDIEHIMREVEDKMEEVNRQLGQAQDALDEEDRETIKQTLKSVHQHNRQFRGPKKRPRYSYNYQYISPHEQDSSHQLHTQHIERAARLFLTDYPHLLSQIAPDEKVIITNKTKHPTRRLYSPNRDIKNTYITISAAGKDILMYRSKKLSRDQFMKRIKVIDTVLSRVVEPDLEVFQHIFKRLYQRDLSTTFFTNRVNYEKIPGVGVTYRMKVFSSYQRGDQFDMPTIKKKNLTPSERKSEVKKLYTEFESNIQSEILEYGRTLKSIPPDESLVFKVTMTKCTGCGIPARIEYRVKQSVLRDYATGKITKEKARKQMTINKSSDQ